MKAIGGTRRQIAQIYLGQALLLGIAAVVIAAPLGAIGARALCRYLAVFLNFDLTSFDVPLWVHFLVALVGLAAPLLAASYPVARGSAITVGAALADFGVSDRAFGTSGLDRALAGVSGLARPLLLAIRNSFRRRTRLALTLVTLSVGGLFFMSALNVRASMINTLDHLLGTRRFDLSINLGTMYPVESIDRAIAGLPGALRSEGWIATEGSVLVAAGAQATPTGGRALHSAGGGGAGGGGTGSGAAHAGGADSVTDRFPVLGIEPGTKLLKLEIGEGRDLAPGDTDALVVNSAFSARNPQVKVGSTVVLRMGPADSSWRVVGISREAFSPPVAYVSRTYFDGAGGHAGMANTVRVALDSTDPSSIDRFKEGLDRNLEAEGIRALSTQSKAEGRYGFDQHMQMIYVFLVVMSVIIGGVGGLGLMTTMSLNVLERRREMGVLRAIGASSRAVWLIVLTEGLAIGLMSFVIATVLAGPLSRSLGDLLASVMFQSQLSFRFDPSGVLIWFAASMGLAALASFLPAWTASRAPVREALDAE
jgi:putative ABC transport system permease protein